MLPAFQGTLGNVCRHFWLSQCGAGGGDGFTTWHPVSGHQGSCSTFYSAKDSPHHKEFFLLFRHQVVSDSVTPWTAALQASLTLTISRSLPKFMSIESVMPSNHLILGHPLLLPPSIFPSIRVFSSESAVHIRWPKYWCFSFSIRLSNEYSGLVSFRIDWIDLAHQRTLKSLLQHHSLKASILQYSAFFTV